MSVLSFLISDCVSNQKQTLHSLIGLNEMHGCASPTSATICTKTSPHIKLVFCVCVCVYSFYVCARVSMCVSVHQTSEEKNNPITETVCLTDIQYVRGQKGGVCVRACVDVEDKQR